MSSNREADYLRDIVENADAIAGYVAGLNFEGFSADRKTVDAVERCLQRITEAAIRIGQSRMQEIAPAVPLAEVRGLGNVLRHAYDAIDLGTLWRTVKEDLPELQAACRAALSPD